MIILDIETCPDEHFPKCDPSAIPIPKNVTKPETIARYQTPEAVEEEFAKRALSPLFGRVLWIGASVWNYDQETMLPDRTVEIAEWFDPLSESAILDEFERWLSARLGHSLIAHFGCTFDFPYLAYRAMINGNFTLSSLVHSPKWGDKYHRDTALVLPDRPSLGDLCKSMRIPHPSASQGRDVYRWLSEGRYDLIASHGRDDVRALNAIVLQFTRAGLL